MPDKSFADFFSDVLATWRALGKFLVLVFALGVFALGFVLGVLKSISTRAEELNLQRGDITASVLFRKPTPEGQEYTVMIAPQGWQRTGIQVRKGDTLQFEAGGRVYVDLKGLNASLDERRKLEEKIEIKRQAGGWKTEKDADFVPEHHFTADEERKMKPVWDWTGPDGVTLEETKRNSLPARQRKSICPSKGYGALLAGIGQQSQGLSRDLVFFVGSSQSTIADRDGWLYFAVNDVSNDEDQFFPDMYFVDNIGFFYARVTVSPAGKHSSDEPGHVEKCSQAE
jgi:hypothetical protein